MLLDRKPVLEGFARHDARKTDPRNTVHLERQYQTVPVNGRGFGQGVGHTHNSLAALLEPNQRRRQRAIDGNGLF